MKFYNKKEPLYLETDTSGVRLGAGLLQVRDGIWFQKNEALDKVVLCPKTFASKSLTSTETRYSIIERETL